MLRCALVFLFAVLFTLGCVITIVIFARARLDNSGREEQARTRQLGCLRVLARFAQSVVVLWGARVP